MDKNLWILRFKKTARIIFRGLAFAGLALLFFNFVIFFNVSINFSFDILNYINLIIFRVVFYVWNWVYYFSVSFFQFWFVSLSFFFKFVLMCVVGFVTFIFGSVFVIGYAIMVIIQSFNDFLRILLSITVQPFTYYEIFRSTGIRISSLFLFRPVIVMHLNDPLTSFQIQHAAEMLLIQALLALFQIVWGVALTLYSLIAFNVSFFYTFIFLIFGFIKLEWLSFALDFYLSYNILSLGILILYIFLLCLIFIKIKLLNFWNFQKIFSFVLENRWFGLNLGPGLSFFDLLFGLATSRVRFMESSIWRLESFILFSSHLRLDPKMTEIIYMW